MNPLYPKDAIGMMASFFVFFDKKVSCICLFLQIAADPLDRNFGCDIIAMTIITSMTNMTM